MNSNIWGSDMENCARGNKKHHADKWFLFHCGALLFGMGHILSEAELPLGWISFQR